MKLILTAATGFFLIFSASAQFAGNLFSGGAEARRVVTSFYGEMEMTPSMVVRVDRIYTDYQRKGFFRIGVLPMGVMEGVTFEVHRTETVTNSLAQLHDWLGSQAAKRFEFRKVSFLTFAGGTNHLESGRARVIADGQWELLDGVRLCSGTNQVVSSSATLQVVGERTGQLVMATSPPLTVNLFARIEFPTAN